MLLRSALVFLNGLQTSRGSALCQISRRNLLSVKVRNVYSTNSQRHAFRTAAKVHTSLASQLKMPFLFTVTTGSLCLFGNEYFGKLFPQENRSRWNSWFQTQPDWSKVYWLICGSCVVVFCGFWAGMVLKKQIPALNDFMTKYFVLRPTPDSTLSSCLQLILSAFAHTSVLHLAVNMYVLHSVTPIIVPEIGKEKFLGCYLFSAVVSGFVSLAHSLVRGRLGGSVGASGAILGLLALAIFRHPELNLTIIFLPMFPIPAPVAFASLATMDLIGLIRGWKFFDHAGHLGGLFSGISWEVLQHYFVPPVKSERNTKPPENEDSSW